MGLTPLLRTMSKKTALFANDGFPNSSPPHPDHVLHLNEASGDITRSDQDTPSRYTSIKQIYLIKCIEMKYIHIIYHLTCKCVL